MDTASTPRPPRRRTASVLLVAVTALALVVATAVGDRLSDGPPVTLPGDLVLAGALTPFEGCDGFLDYVRDRALEEVTPYGLGGGGGDMPAMLELDGAGRAVMDDTDTEASIAPEQATGAPVAGEDFSATNVQEVGVDEPDGLKTDGRTLYLVNRGVLEVLDVTGDQPRALGSLDLRDAWDARLLLHGDRLLVTSSAGTVIPFAGERAAASVLPRPWGGGTTLTAIDVSDPTDPTVLERLTLDGWTLSSRMVDGVVRVVVRTEPGVDLPWVYPETGGLRAERNALEANREVIRRSQAEDWLPYYVHETADGRSSEGTLLDCDRISRPEPYAGLGVLSVLTVDLGTGALTPGREATGVLAAGDTVYASAERLYVATTRWVDWIRLPESQRERRAQEVTTEIHAFDISDPRTAVYLASGEVPGTLLSQWAMSEHEGRLRVASTVGDTWFGSRSPSESVVTVLEHRDDRLVEVGQVTGLGVTERIYAVRFIGDVGYVVTFRETDPLYTLDLSDPTDPRVTGELKILGYSAYLHPVGEDLLLGVGQDADERGMTKGLQLSLFDVSDPEAPAVLDQVDLPGGHSDVEYDHHAFLHWPRTGLTVVPFQRWWSGLEDEPRIEGPTSGALALTASRDGLAEEAMLEHTSPYLRDLGIDDPLKRRPGEEPWEVEERTWQYQYETRIVRSLVVGDRLLTVSEIGIAVHDLDDLDERGWLTFG